jgi:hypothetical protein
MSRKWWLIAPVFVILWIAEDLLVPRQASLARFDGRAVGRLETAMWRSYYGHQPARLYGQLLDLMRHQYHLPFWRASLAACYAPRAALAFQEAIGSLVGRTPRSAADALVGLSRYDSITSPWRDRPARGPAADQVIGVKITRCPDDASNVRSCPARCLASNFLGRDFAFL